MPAVNDVGEPGAREPHARFDGRELETERLVRVTEVGQPDGKPRASGLLDLPPKPRHRASSRPYTPLVVRWRRPVLGRTSGIGRRAGSRPTRFDTCRPPVRPRSGPVCWSIRPRGWPWWGRDPDLAASVVRRAEGLPRGSG